MTLVETNCGEDVAKELPPFLEGMFIVEEQVNEDIYLDTVIAGVSRLTGNYGGDYEPITAKVRGNSIIYSDTESQSGDGCRYETVTSVVIGVEPKDVIASPITSKFLNGTLLGSFKISGNCGDLKIQSCKVGYRISGLGVHMKEYLTNTVSGACRFSEMLGFESEKKQAALEGSSHALKMVPEGFSLNLKR
jgi:hypothetical protein